MRLLLTGANGFTGFHFANAAKEYGFEVFPLKSDLTNFAAISAEVVDIAPNYVVHFAGISSTTHANEEDLYRVNLLGTMNLLKALCELRQRPQKVVLASTASVYGSSTKMPISEYECPSPLSHYAASKLAMESMSNIFKGQLPIVYARPFNYTGVGHDERFVIPKIVGHFIRRSPTIELGNLHVKREYNDVRVVCEIYIKLLLKGVAGEIYNIASSKVHSLEFVIGRLQEISKHKIEVSVNSEYVRKNDIDVLAGCTKKLEGAIGVSSWIDLSSTLEWMYGSHAKEV
jgi:nucleoside-diphosphate-sugar epimerase